MRKLKEDDAILRHQSSQRIDKDKEKRICADAEVEQLQALFVSQQVQTFTQARLLLQDAGPPKSV